MSSRDEGASYRELHRDVSAAIPKDLQHAHPPTLEEASDFRDDGAASENLIEIVRSNYDAINRFDPDAVLSFVHPEVVVVDASRPDPTSPDGSWHGKEGWGGRFLLDWAESFDEMRYEPVEMSAMGDTVIAEVLVRGRGRGSGIPVENRRFHVVTFREGKGVRFEVCAQRDEAVEAARQAAT